MEIEITTTKQVKEIINIEFPYFYKNDLSDLGTYVIYGKMTKDFDYTIREVEDGSTTTYELEKDTRWDGNYFKSEYKSSEKEYEDAKRRALEFFNCL